MMLWFPDAALWSFATSRVSSQFRHRRSSGEHTGHKAGVPQEAVAHRGNANAKYRLQDVCQRICVAFCHHVAPDHSNSKWTSCDS